MFEVAIYTDTRADEAIDGVDGFNFQAISPGVTAQDRQVIRDRMLHRVVSGWSLHHDPLDHPPTFAYLKRGDRHYMARGVSTGLTLNGRPGNLITQTLVTSDSDDFGSQRPAQLFGALQWDLTRAESQQISPWAGPLEIDPRFTVRALSQMVLDDPWAVSHLPHFITMFEELLFADAKRLIIVTRDALAAQRWIALGTRFVDALSAQELSIRGMVADPMTASGDIVAASPEFGPQPVATVRRAGVNIINLDDRQISPLQPSESAAIQASWFLTQDCLAALSAIELARGWERHLGKELSTQGAAVAAELSVQTGIERWRTAMRTTLELAEHDLDHDLLIYADVLLDALVAHHPNTAADAQLAGKTTMALLRLGNEDATEHALGILLHTLEWATTSETVTAWLAAIVATPMAAVPQWSDQAARNEACRLIAGFPDLLSRASLSELFIALAVFCLHLPEPALDSACRSLASWWAEHPELSVDRHRWAHIEPLQAALQATLLASWSTETGPAVDALYEGYWNWLETEGTDPTAAWIRAAEVARRPVEDRSALLQGSALPAESCLLVWGTAPLDRSAALLSQWVCCNQLPPKASARIAAETKQHLARGRSLAWLRELMLAIHKSRGGTPELLRMAVPVARADSWFTIALRTPTFGNRAIREVAAELPRLTPWFHDRLGQLILSSDAAVQAVLVDVDPAGVSAATRLAMQQELSGADTLSAVRLALRLMVAQELEISRPAASALKEFVNAEANGNIVRDLRLRLDKQDRERLAGLEQVSVLRKVGRYLRDPRP